MTIDYYEELLNILKTNKIKKMPSLEAISDSEDIALMILENFIIEKDFYDSISFSEWYKAGNFGSILKCYNNNIGFWETGLKKMAFAEEFVLSEEFKKDFPTIRKYFISNKEQLIYFFNKYKNIEFFKLINVSNLEKDKIYKDFLIENYYKITKEEIKRYEEDHGFIKEILIKDIRFYNDLSVKNKLNNELIKIIISDLNSFLYLPIIKQDEFFDLWFDLNKLNIKINEFIKLPDNYKDRVLNERVDLLYSL